MTNDRRLLAGALGLALVLGACGASTASPAATTSPGAPAATPAATQAAVPTEAPAASEQAEATEAPTDDSGTGSGPLNDLANLIPAQAGGATFERVGFDGDQLGIYGAAAGLDAGKLDPILKANGKTLSDVNFAFASGTGDGGSTAMVYAMQIEGLNPTDLLAAMGLDLTDFQQASLGGKTVYTQGAGGFGMWAYPKDDKLFLVLLTTEDMAKAILEQLP